jgi:uncharacterized protein (TIGR02594 family)
MPITNNLDLSFLTTTELKNGHAIMTNLSDEKFNRVKLLLHLTIPGVLGPTTLQTFVRYCANSGFDLSSEGLRKFKVAHPPLNPDLPLGPKTAEAYYQALGFDLDVDEELPWMEFAKAELAARVREFPGDPDNPRIVEYHRTTTLPMPYVTQDETDWCSSFVNWCMMKADVRRTKSAMARSWKNWGHPLDQPRYGCVAVFWREDLNGPYGHVGFFVSEDANNVLLLAGNQGHAVSKSNQPKNRLLGYRWPRDEDRLS